ncbi:hypothetical protein OFC51_35245, partial [Escherichia coli]|nr:hypothetical protein [Escherichia coli]
TPYEQELISSGQSYGGPSSIDMLNSAKEQMPSIVVYQAGTINGRRKIAIEIANPNVRVIPDQNCSRRELR